MFRWQREPEIPRIHAWGGLNERTSDTPMDDDDIEPISGLSDADRQMRALEGLQDLKRYGVSHAVDDSGDIWQIVVRGDPLPPMDTGQVHAFLMGANAIRRAAPGG